MVGERHLVPMDPTYVAAVGVATYIFARLEWDAVYCCEKIQPGFLGTVGVKTAGQVAADFRALAASVLDPIARQQTVQVATEFSRLVKLRNDLIHSNPCTTPGGEQRLNRRGTIIRIGDIEATSENLPDALAF